MALQSQVAQHGHSDIELDSGHARLNQLGYKQELKRDLSVLSNFAFSSSIALVLSPPFITLVAHPLHLVLLAENTEEIKDADRNGPKGIIGAVGISIIVGLGYILGITFVVTDIPYLLSEDNDAGGYAIAEIFYLSFKRRYGHGLGGIISLVIVAVAIFFCGMSSITSNSRMAYAFSRDGAMPLSSLWHKVNKQEVPINAVWLSVFISFCMALTVAQHGRSDIPLDSGHARLNLNQLGYKQELKRDLSVLLHFHFLLYQY